MNTTRLGWDIFTTTIDNPRLTPFPWITGYVRAGDAYTVLDELARQFDATVESIRKDWSWGWADRPVRGGDDPSEHSAGTAVDFNAPLHPLGASGTFSATQVQAIRKILDYLEGAVRWGGFYPGRKDEMHFELQGGVRKLESVAEKIQRDRTSQMAGYSSPLPVGCRLTSNFGMRTLGGKRGFHAGTDWGPPVVGQRGIPVYAPADYTVISVGRGLGLSTSVVPYHSGLYVWLDLGVHGGDRMRFYVGHLESYNVKAGDRGKAGDQLGIMGGSGPRGANDYAVHAHIGVSVNHLKPVDAWSPTMNAGWTDPVVWFRSKGIVVGSTPPVTASTTTTASTTPTYTKRRVMVDDAKVYANRGADKRLVGTPSKGYNMNVVEESGSWTKVRWRYDGKYQNAWIATSAFTAPKSEPKAKPKPPVVTSQGYTKRAVAVDDAEITANRGNDRRVVGRPSKGYRLNVVEESGSWTKVRWHYDGKYQNAWIPSKDLA